MNVRIMLEFFSTCTYPYRVTNIIITIKYHENLKSSLTSDLIRINKISGLKTNSLSKGVYYWLPTEGVLSQMYYRYANNINCYSEFDYDLRSVNTQKVFLIFSSLLYWVR